MSEQRVKKFLIFTASSMGILILASIVLLVIAIKEKKNNCKNLSKISIAIDGKIISVDYEEEIKISYIKNNLFYIDFYDKCGNSKIRTIEVRNE